MNIRYLSLCLPILVFACNNQPDSLYPDSLSTDQALAAFQILPGFEIELFAAEPHIQDPVSMAVDGTGKIYVVEMPDYPYKPEAGEGKGRIKVLEDTDRDGQIDQSTVFAENLSEATSILPYQSGVLVTAAPYILYLEDTNGDNKADTEEVMFSGFFEHNSEAQITNLRYSVDNWIYGSNFGQPGNIRYGRDTGRAPLSIKGGDFRFRLDRDRYEVAAGPTQFGQALDDWGNRFMTQNTLHIQQAVIPWRYLHRHEYLPITKAVENISDHDLDMYQLTPPPYWRAERTARRQKRYDDEGLDRIEYGEDHFTGCSGGTLYLADAFPKEYYGTLFTGDVAGNLVHRDIFTPREDSPLLIAQRDTKEGEAEFLATTDPWFRPTNFYVGPNGYLYVIDMYRQHIETPLSIPEDLKEDMDFYNGSDKGRIYRIKPTNSQGAKTFYVYLQSAASGTLANLLTHKNHWWRINAQRILVERQDTSVAPILEKIFSGSIIPQARLHALYSLEGLGLMNKQHVQSLLFDPHPALRKHGIKLSESYPEVFPFVKRLVNDPSVEVLFQLCLSLGEFNNDQAIPALVEIASRYGKEKWFRKAILSSHAGSSFEFLSLLHKTSDFFSNAEEGSILFLQEIAFIIAARNIAFEVDAFDKLLSTSALLTDESYQVAAQKGMNQGRERHQIALDHN